MGSRRRSGDCAIFRRVGIKVKTRAYGDVAVNEAACVSRVKYQPPSSVLKIRRDRHRHTRRVGKPIGEIFPAEAAFVFAPYSAAKSRLILCGHRGGNSCHRLASWRNASDGRRARASSRAREGRAVVGMPGIVMAASACRRHHRGTFVACVYLP